MVTRMREAVLASPRIFSEESVVRVLYPGCDRTNQDHVRAIARQTEVRLGGKSSADRLAPRQAESKSLVAD
jgi:hypothetical protein